MRSKITEDTSQMVFYPCKNNNLHTSNQPTAMQLQKTTLTRAALAQTNFGLTRTFILSLSKSHGLCLRRFVLLLCYVGIVGVEGYCAQTWAENKTHNNKLSTCTNKAVTNWQEKDCRVSDQSESQIWNLTNQKPVFIWAGNWERAPWISGAFGAL